MDTDGSSSHKGICPTEYRPLSPVLSAFPWATPHIIQAPKPLTDFTTILSPHKHFIHALHRFECSVFRLGKSVINTTALAPLIGLDVRKDHSEDSSAVVTVHPRETSVASKRDYSKLCSILCAYRTFEVLALDSEISVLQPPVRLLPPLSLPKFDRDSESLIGFDKLDDWPKILLDFRTLMSQSGPSQPSDKVYPGSKHLALLRMTSHNGQKMAYVNLVDNFLQAALHLFYLKMTEFPDGSLPDYPDLLNDHLRIFKDETSTDHFIEDQDEGNHYLREMRRAETSASSSATIHKLGTPLLLALLLTPFYLLFQLRITKRSFNRRLVLESFSHSSPYKTPLVLEIERSIWRSLMALADAAMTPHEALDQLVSKLPWPAIEAASNSPSDRRMFCMSPVIAQPSPSPTALQPSLHLGRSEAPPTIPNSQLSMSTGDNASCDNVKEPPSTPSMPLLTSTSNSTDCTSSATNTSHDSTMVNEERPELPSMLAPMDHDSRSPTPSMPVLASLPTSTDYYAPLSTIELRENAIGNKDCPSSPSSRSSSISTGHPPSPTIELRQTASSTNGRRPPSAAASESRANPVHNRQGQGSLENSLASLINMTFQAHPISSSHSGTVDPSRLSSLLGPSGARNFSREDDITMDDLSSELSSLEDENSECPPVRPANKSNPDVQPFHNDDTDDGESSPSSDRSMYSGVKKTIRNTPGNGGGRRDSANQKKHRGGANIGNKGAVRDNGGSNVNMKGHKAKPVSREGSNAISASNVDEKNPRKRPRSGSLDRPGNSRENPINVDDFLSMFEPAILNEYAKDEEISLGREEAPRIVCDQSFRVYDIDGNPHEFTPEFHHTVFNNRFKELMKLVHDGYINGLPPHIADPQKSCLAKMQHKDLSTMSAIDIQNKMRHKQVVVTGLPFDDAMQFDVNGLRTVVGSMTAQISITDFSLINPGTDCVPSVVSGYVNDLLENASSTGKILNGLDLPMWSSYRPFNNYETDAVAWDITRGTHRIPLNAPFPTQDREWGIAGLKHVLTFLHIDCDGFNTRYGPKVGRKLWAFLRPRHSKKLSSIYFFMDDDGFSLCGKPKDVEYDFEAVVLRPGDELHMQPNSAHWVYGIDDVISHGGHYYSSFLMQETLQGIIHAFVLNKFLTNTEHIPSRHLLRRILIFYHVGLVEGSIMEKDPAWLHLPNVETMEGVLNVICLAVLVVLGNVLDFRTYSAPNQGEDDEASPAQSTLMNTGDINAIPNNERIAYCYARGVALRILNWLRSCTTFTGPPDGIADDLISLFFVQILASLSMYKSVAEANSYGGVPHCTSRLLDRQITNVLEVDPTLKAAWECKGRVPLHSLALQEKEKYNIEWLRGWEPSWRAPCGDFALAGQTPFDIKYFEATKQRINSENANVIVGDGVQPLRKKVKVA